jgi:hypothetical protein
MPTAKRIEARRVEFAADWRTTERERAVVTPLPSAPMAITTNQL